MKKLRFLCLTVVACAAIGCSDDEPLGNDDALRCQGRLGIDGAASATVVSRGEIDLAELCGFTTPSTSDLRLDISGTYTEYHQTEDGHYVAYETDRQYSNHWTTLAAYNKNKPALYPGVYTAILAYGDKEAKGPNKPYFFGQGQGVIEWDAAKEQVKEKVVNCKIAVKIANSAVLITADPGFKGYFSEPQFQLYLNGSAEPLKDEAKNPYVFTLSDTDKPIFLPAGTKVVVKGTVRRPSQTTSGDADGELMEIEVPEREAAGGTLHTFQFTAKAGGVGVDVVFKDYEAGSSADVELNDDSKTE